MNQSRENNELDKAVEKDLRLLGKFIEVYCDGLHQELSRDVMELKSHAVEEIMGHRVVLCEACRKLFAHAWVKRTMCPMDPKPQCKHCPDHCYATKYRQQIKEVMKYSGRKLVMRGRVDYLLKLWT